MTEIKELIKLSGEIANKHGWKIIWVSATDIVKDRNIINQSQILQNVILNKGRILTIGDSLSLVHSEVSEALDAYRNDDKGNFGEECADIAIRLFHMCYDLKINLEKEIKLKMKKNKERPVHHGRKNL